MYEYKIRPPKYVSIDVYLLSLEVVNSENKVIIQPNRSMTTCTILHKLSGKLGTWISLALSSAGVNFHKQAE